MESILKRKNHNKDYKKYLKEIGAANERDDIFAVSAYCPIMGKNHLLLKTGESVLEQKIQILHPVFRQLWL